MKIVDYKVQGGKMLRVRVNLENETIRSITILGDFFLHPESTIEVIEQELVGCRVEVNEIASRIQRVLDAHEADLIGATALDIAKAIERALESE